MDVLTIVLLVVIVLALSGVGYGYYRAPADVGPAPWVNPVGILALLLVVGFIILLATGTLVWPWGARP